MWTPLDKMDNKLKNKPTIVYVAVNSINKKKYVGVTCRKLSDRKLDHSSAARRGGNFIFYKAIRKYGFESFNWYTLSKWDNYSDALAEEVRVIALVKPEYNATAGGQGVIMERTQEWKDRIGISNKGKTISLEARQKGIKTRKEKKVGWKKIVCLNDGNIFEKIRDAAKFYSIHPHPISHVLKGIQASTKGFYFSYFNEKLLDKNNRLILLDEKKKRTLYKGPYSDERRKKISEKNTGKIGFWRGKSSPMKGRSHSEESKEKIRAASSRVENIERLKKFSFPVKKIICIEDNKIFESVSEAARFYNASTGNLVSVLKGKRNQTKGKRFKYLEESK